LKPRGRRGKGEGRVVYLGRGLADYVKVFQDEALAIICPLADNILLKKG